MNIVLGLLLAAVGVYGFSWGVMFRGKGSNGRLGAKWQTLVMAKDLPILFGLFTVFMGVKALAGF
jgi:hypothetical protein